MDILLSNTTPLLAAGLVMVALFLLVSSLFSGFGKQADVRRNVHRRLNDATMENEDDEIHDVLRKDGYGNSMLKGMSFARNLRRDILMAGMGVPVATIVLYSLLLGVVGFCLGIILLPVPAASVVPALFLAAIPVMVVQHRKAARMARFQSQLPDALDLVARALKAGHAFTGALRLIAEEFGDPIGPEFGETLDEINFGLSVKQAMFNLSQRVDCPDLQFFIVSVNIQRETGGNLAEIIGTIGMLIRERFKLQGKIAVLSAESRTSAVILTLLPIGVGAYIWMSNPEYISLLVTDPTGQMMFGMAIGLMLLGIVVIRKMIRIEV